MEVLYALIIQLKNNVSFKLMLHYYFGVAGRSEEYWGRSHMK